MELRNNVPSDLIIEEGAKNEEEKDRKQVEAILQQTEWVEEANEIPIEELNNEEQLIIVKCRNRQTLTDKEQEQLRNILGRYREAIRKLKPTETIENVEKNIQVTQDMNTILERMKQAKDTQTIKFYYPLSSDEDMLIELVVNNEIDAEAIDDLQENLGLFEDLSQDELKLYSQYSHGEQMTREEQAIAKRIEEKIAKMSHHNVAQVRETAIKFLAKQTRIATDKDVTEAQMIEFYSIMKIGPLLALFERIQGCVGLSHIDRDELFR